jgi:spore coat polysaccharide biosynthesis protein SpsF
LKKIKIGVIVQARTGSTRLPNKVLKPFFQDKTILDILFERLALSEHKLPVILATSNKQKDNILKEVAFKHGVYFYQGDEENVLKRFVDASKEHNFDFVVRICADNPFLHLKSIDLLVKMFLADTSLNYLSFCDENGTPVMKTHYGLFGEVVSVSSLKRALAINKSGFYCEHVTNYIYENSDIFKVKLLPVPDKLLKRNDIRLTIDTLDDFENLQDLYHFTVGFDQDVNIEHLINNIDKQPGLLDKMKLSIKANSK